MSPLDSTTGSRETAKTIDAAHPTTTFTELNGFFGRPCRKRFPVPVASRPVEVGCVRDVRRFGERRSQ